MKVLAVEGPSATVKPSALDLLILHNTLNEVCHGMDIRELHTRIGADEQEIRALLHEVSALYAKVDARSLSE
jgi:hypothetical protein